MKLSILLALITLVGLSAVSATQSAQGPLWLGPHVQQLQWDGQTMTLSDKAATLTNKGFAPKQEAEVKLTWTGYYLKNNQWIIRMRENKDTYYNLRLGEEMPNGWRLEEIKKANGKPVAVVIAHKSEKHLMGLE